MNIDLDTFKTEQVEWTLNTCFKARKTSTNINNRALIHSCITELRRRFPK